VTAESPGSEAGTRATAMMPEPLDYLLEFAVSGRARFLGHLDTLELLRRAVRRAGGRLARSAGTRPKPLLSLALPRGVGVAGRRELGEFRLAAEPPADFGARLAAALPAGFELLAVRRVGARPSLAARVRAARYRVAVDLPAGVVWSAALQGADGQTLASVFAHAVDGYSRRESAPIERIRGGKRRRIDTRRFVLQIRLGGERDEPVVDYTAAVTGEGSVRPEEVVQALAGPAGLDLRIKAVERVEILLEEPAAK
jgi:radical SAM-linked protein